MPIFGLTDAVSSFKEIGRLRLGISKEEAEKINPQTKRKYGPTELPYFRADFRPEELNAQALFLAEYGDQPTRINIRVPFNEVERFWDANYEVYSKSGMLGKADGLRWTYLRDHKNGRLIVSREGRLLLPMEGERYDEKTGEAYLPFDPTIPVYSYVNGKGQDTAVYAKPKGKLKIIIPELNRACYVLMLTQSIYNVANISAELAGIKELAENIGVKLPFVPMVLSRRLDEISVSYDGKKRMEKHYLCHIEIEESWSETHFKLLASIMPGLALPAPKPVSFELPSGLPESVTGEDFGDGESDDFDFVPEPKPAQPATPPTAQPPKNPPATTRQPAPVKPIPPADMTWCEWCSDKPAAPGVPCKSCAELGARPGDGQNTPAGKTAKSAPRPALKPAPAPLVIDADETPEPPDDGYEPPDFAALAQQPPAKPASETAEQKLDRLGAELWPGKKWSAVKPNLSKATNGDTFTTGELLSKVEERHKGILSGNLVDLKNHIEKGWKEVPGLWAAAEAARNIEPALAQPFVLLNALAQAVESTNGETTPDELTNLILAFSK